MLRFEGDRTFRQPPAELWAHLADAHFLVQCIPDIETVREVQTDHASMVVRPGFSFVRGTLEVDLRMIEKVPPSLIRVAVHSKGIGSSADVEATLNLAEHEGGTRVHWVVQVTALGGLLKMIPGGLIQGAAQKVVEDAWNAVRDKLNVESEEKVQGGPEGV